MYEFSFILYCRIWKNDEQGLQKPPKKVVQFWTDGDPQVHQLISDFNTNPKLL